MVEKLLALTIDLDPLEVWLRAEGLGDGQLSGHARDAAPLRAIERFAALCDQLGVTGTAFVAGRDAVDARIARELSTLHRLGHEVASRSFAHDLALSSRSLAEIDDDLARAEGAIADATGERPVGLRAPGGTLSPRLEETLRLRGYLYDASLVPSPPLFALRAAWQSLLQLAGRAVDAPLGSAAQLLRSRGPVFERGLWELPVTALPGARVPWTGAVLATLPSELSRGLSTLLAADTLVVVQLSALDLCEPADGLPEPLLRRRPDLSLPRERREATLVEALRALRDDRRPVTLKQACGVLAELEQIAHPRP